MSALDPGDFTEDLARLSRDPLRWVLWAFPWGEPGTELAQRGLEPWQVDFLVRVRTSLASDPYRAIREATASGHGIGKSTLVAWLILWAISTHEDTRGVVTANTEKQLSTKTWVELAKWYRLFIARDLFRFEATKLYSADPDHEKTWRVDMIPWSEKNTEAFAGLHNQGSRVLVVFDEASAIPDVIWETTEGALTDANTEIIWAVFGNPTKNTGRFRDCFEGGRFYGLWGTRTVDSREVSFTNKRQIEEWLHRYGDDSDFSRVRVKGQFPRAGSTQFIAADIIAAAANAARSAEVQRWDPLVIGVDVARFGTNESVIVVRKGRDGRTRPPVRLRGVDTMSLAGRVADLYQELRADAVFVDGGGVGGGVVDRLRQLGVPCFDVQFGGAADRPLLTGHEKFANKRTEMYGWLRDWLNGGAIPDDQDLISQLISIEYGFNKRDEIQLVSKDDMDTSPDLADAYALTFAYAVMPSYMAGPLPKEELVSSEYDPFAEEVA